MKSILILIFVSCTYLSFGQSYTSYFTGDTTDVVTNPVGGTCLMGGNTENDEAMKWFLQRADGGDILVLRASGSDGYNNYFYSQLGVTINSVETIVFNNSQAASNPYVQQRIDEAEAIWLAGGDQWNYVDYWRNTPIADKVNDGIKNRNMVIGGTSAGMAVLGSIYFSAQNGTVTSQIALGNPYHSRVTIDSTDFFEVPFLENVITDTHYDDPDRKGRHMVFLARAFQDWNIAGKGIACDEYTSVCIDENGIAHAFGEYPSYDDNVYFLQVNCENFDSLPENCVAGQTLDWNLGGDAVKVYNLKGNLSGSNSFDLNTWETGSGGTWENWYVDNGAFNNTVSSPIQCFPVNTHQFNQLAISIAPNPVVDYFTISGVGNIDELIILDINGRILKIFLNIREAERLNISELANGVYFLKVKIGEESGILKLIK